jgi:hypothetical protein
MKAWMQGPFLDITKYASDDIPTTITLYPDLFETLFDNTDRYNAFYNYRLFYHTDKMNYEEVKYLLENFKQCNSCVEWFDSNELIDTEELIGGGVGHVCEACLDTLG